MLTAGGDDEGCGMLVRARADESTTNGEISMRIDNCHRQKPPCAFNAESTPYVDDGGCRVPVRIVTEIRVYIWKIYIILYLVNIGEKCDLAFLGVRATASSSRLDRWRWSRITRV